MRLIDLFAASAHCPTQVKPAVHFVLTFGCLETPSTWIDGVTLLQPVPNSGHFLLAIETFHIFYADGCLPKTVMVAEASSEFLELNLTTSVQVLPHVYTLLGNFKSSDNDGIARYNFLGLTMYPIPPTNISCINAIGTTIDCFDVDHGYYTVLLNELLDTARSMAAWSKICDACDDLVACSAFCSLLFADDRRRLSLVNPAKSLSVTQRKLGRRARLDGSGLRPRLDQQSMTLSVHGARAYADVLSQASRSEDINEEHHRRLSAYSQLAAKAYDYANIPNECNTETIDSNCYRIFTSSELFDTVLIKGDVCEYAFRGTDGFAFLGNSDNRVSLLEGLGLNESSPYLSASIGGPGFQCDDLSVSCIVNGNLTVHESFAEYLGQAWAWLHMDIFANECGGSNPNTPSVNSPIGPIFAGHGLGGAAAMLAKLTFGGTAYTFGAPKVFYRTQAETSDMASDINRVYHEWDAVAGDSLSRYVTSNSISLSSGLLDFRHRTGSVKIVCAQTPQYVYDLTSFGLGYVKVADAGEVLAGNSEHQAFAI